MLQYLGGNVLPSPSQAPQNPWCKMQSLDSEVGYKRPPKHSQWKPGQSGNPKGRPKRKKSLPVLLKETLFRPVTIKERGKRRKVPYIEALLRAVAQLTLNGDPKARRDLLELIKCHPTAVKHQQPLRTITPGMSNKEAAEIYAETLRAVPGLIEPEFELDPEAWDKD